MKLKAHIETDTYISAGGYYCIRQHNSEMNGDQTIVLSLPQLELIVLSMQKAIANSEAWWSDAVDEAQK